MTDTDEISAQQRDRSPAFPVVPIESALQRLAEFDVHFKRSQVRPDKVGDAWNIKTKAYADRIAAALRYFGFLEYQGAGKARSVAVSEEGRKYLRTQQEEKKLELIKTAALRPKQIGIYWENWGVDRPVDAACLDVLMDDGFSEAGARDFLKVYDATISFAKLSESDKIPSKEELTEEEDSNDEELSRKPSVIPGAKVKLMDNERIVFTEENNPMQYVKVVASGEVDDTLLDAIEDYIKRQKKRLEREAKMKEAAN